MHTQLLTLSDELENDIMLLSHCAGSFVVVDESGKEKAIKDGSKVAVLYVTQVLFYKQVGVLQKSAEWPGIFKFTNSDGASRSLERHTSNHEDNDQSDSDDDGLSPLEANTNRTKPLDLQAES